MGNGRRRLRPDGWARRSGWIKDGVIVVTIALSATATARAQDDQTCLSCHGQTARRMLMALAIGVEDPERLIVSEEDYERSVHGTLGVQCVLCHQDISGFPHPDEVQPVNCGLCHARIQDQYAGSLHGYALQRGNGDAPRCASCHGTHDVLRSSDPDSRTHRVQVPSTCATCHGPAGLRTDQLVKLPSPFTPYAQSVHGAAIGRGAASCIDCHGVHDLRGPVDPSSRINRMNVAATCGQCHADIQVEYSQSIHGRALQAGVINSPTCTDCHGEHLILSHRDPEAKTYAARIATETCGTCHDDPVIIAKYRLAGGVVESYVDSYHGWASRRDYERAATCVSCHSTHSVLPEADSASTIHSANVVATCQQCHPTADMEFALSYTHESASITANPVNRVIRIIYLVLIAAVIGGMVLHNLVILNYYLMLRRREENGSKGVVRFDRAEVWQHLVLTVSFVMLVITGFALRFPEAWWVRGLSALAMTEPVRSMLHRVFGVLLILVSILHVVYVSFTARGRKGFRAMVPEKRDVTDFLGTLRFHMGRTRRRVKFGRYDYTQKAEYWALVWGTVIMALTGLVLWFPELTVKVFPSLVIPAAQTIHYYEAWLASLAVLVWHFFFVIFHPDAYPMNWAWLTGKIPLESVKQHHRRWYEEEIALSEATRQEEVGATAGDEAGD